MKNLGGQGNPNASGECETPPAEKDITAFEGSAGHITATPLLRRVCAWCRIDLPGSNLNAGPDATTHGMCVPPCPPAIAMGWGAVL